MSYPEILTDSKHKKYPIKNNIKQNKTSRVKGIKFSVG
jgi:hypothetical protein